MRRDVCRFFQADIQNVFNAYINAIKQKFGKESQATPYSTISFGLNYSAHYNMTGGACHVHLIPYNGGTAVDIRYSMIQFYGARYGRHEEDLVNAVQQILGVPGQKVELPIDMFTEAEGTTVAPPVQPVAPPAAVPQPVVAPEPAPQPQPVPQPRMMRFCPECGTERRPGAKFCMNCGYRFPD